MRDRQARSCYGHFAGVVGVQLMEEMQARGWLTPHEEGDRTHYHVTTEGVGGLAALGVDVSVRPKTKRLYSYGCTDRTEKVHHLGGYLGEQLLQYFLERGWVVRPFGDRVLQVTAEGERDCELLRVVQERVV